MVADSECDVTRYDISNMKIDISCTRTESQKLHFCDWNINVSYVLMAECCFDKARIFLKHYVQNIH